MQVKREVKSSVKDESLIEKRRDQIIQGAVRLFKEKGFHRATTREIATAAGFSIGTLYEYIRTKEDVLYLVCDSIYNEVQSRLSTLMDANAILVLERGKVSAIGRHDQLLAGCSTYRHLWHRQTTRQVA